jgi:hypothetical protein
VFQPIYEIACGMNDELAGMFYGNVWKRVIIDCRNTSSWKLSPSLLLNRTWGKNRSADSTLRATASQHRHRAKAHRTAGIYLTI